MSEVVESKQGEDPRQSHNIELSINGEHHRPEVATMWPLNGGQATLKVCLAILQSAAERREIHKSHQVAAWE